MSAGQTAHVDHYQHRQKFHEYSSKSCIKALHSEHLSRSSVRPINNNRRLRDGTSENCALIYKHLTIQHLQKGLPFPKKRSVTSSTTKGHRLVPLDGTRSGATEPFPLGRVWVGVMKAERHLFHDKRAPDGTLLSGRGDSNTRPLRPERSALANCATSRNSIIYLTKRGLRFRETPFVGMRRRERPTPTSLTWCANQLRHIPNRTAKIAIFSYHQIF